MLNVLRPVMTRLFTPVGKVLARTPITPNAITVIGTVGVVGGALGLFPIEQVLPGAWLLHDLRVPRHAGRRPRPDEGHRHLGRVPGLDHGPDRQRRHLRQPWMMSFMLGGRNPLLAGVCLFCLVTGNLVSYVKARAEGLGLRCDVGLIERPERMVISLVAVGISGLGVPYILNVGLWALAVGSTFFLAASARGSEAAKAPGDQGGSPQDQGWRDRSARRGTWWPYWSIRVQRAADGDGVAGLEGDVRLPQSWARWIFSEVADITRGASRGRRSRCSRPTCAGC